MKQDVETVGRHEPGKRLRKGCKLPCLQVSRTGQKFGDGEYRTRDLVPSEERAGIIVAQIGVPHYINHFRNGLLCLGETTSMSCLDSCGHLGLCV